MTPEQVTAVLLMVAAAESRPVDEAQIAFWTATLAVHQITEEEFRWAVVRHYANSPYPIRPAHVWGLIEGRRSVAALSEVLAQTEERQQQNLLYERATMQRDWSAYDRSYPGLRKIQVQRELDWWSGRDEPTPQEILDQAVELGLLHRGVEG